MMIRRRFAFTLVELLVVVAVIAILVSILLPVLSKARYQARLAVCAGGLHQNGIASAAYASANRNRFPQRWDFTTDIGTSAPMRIAQLGPAEDHDLRPLFAPYTLINSTFRCPLASAKVDMEFVAARLEIDCSYSMWFNWPSNTLLDLAPDISDPLRRLDDEMIATDTNGQEHRFTVLMDDFFRDIPASTVGYRTESVHPDQTRTLSASFRNGEFIGSNQRVFAYFDGNGLNRHPVDRNFLFTDGWVRTLMQIRRDDPRLSRIRNFWGWTEHQLPPNR